MLPMDLAWKMTSFRMEGDRPFNAVGVDSAEPLHSKLTKKKNGKAMSRDSRAQP